MFHNGRTVVSVAHAAYLLAQETRYSRARPFQITQRSSSRVQSASPSLYASQSSLLSLAPAIHAQSRPQWLCTRVLLCCIFLLHSILTQEGLPIRFSSSSQWQQAGHPPPLECIKKRRGRRPLGSILTQEGLPTPNKNKQKQKKQTQNTNKQQMMITKRTKTNVPNQIFLFWNNDCVCLFSFTIPCLFVAVDTVKMRLQQFRIMFEARCVHNHHT